MSKEATGAPPFSISVSRLPQEGQHVRFAADGKHLKAIADRFGIVGADGFEADLFVQRWRDDGVAVSGTLTATAIQTDVVTLDPVRQAIEEEVQLFFVPETSGLARSVADPGSEIDVDPGDETVEVFRGDRIDLAEPLTQLLGLALDPYPRAENVTFDAVVEGEGEPSPFAVLARMRERKLD